MMMMRGGTKLRKILNEVKKERKKHKNNLRTIKLGKYSGT